MTDVLARRQTKRSGVIETRSPRSGDVVSSAGDLLIAAQVEVLTEAMEYRAKTVPVLYQELDELVAGRDVGATPCGYLEEHAGGGAIADSTQVGAGSFITFYSRCICRVISHN